MTAYNIDATGDCVVGDEVKFLRATFTGKYPRGKFAGLVEVTGVIVGDSYGKEKQQHTFSIQTSDGGVIRIKGRNLYSHKVMRKPWENEEERLAVRYEKNRRGEAARAARYARINHI